MMQSIALVFMKDAVRKNCSLLKVHDSKDSIIEDYFSHLLSGADVELEGHALIDIKVGKDKNINCIDV